VKVLFFHATAGHPKVAPPLMSQAGNVLRPFNRFLGQAIHTAKQRQTRYQLPWERVRNLQSIDSSQRTAYCVCRAAHPASSSPTGHQVRAMTSRRWAS
jgi:hypothetical protein